jgi:hypothetical protein
MSISLSQTQANRRVLPTILHSCIFLHIDCYVGYFENAEESESFSTAAFRQFFKDVYV